MVSITILGCTSIIGHDYEKDYEEDKNLSIRQLVWGQMQEV